MGASERARALRLVLGANLVSPTPKEMTLAPGLPQGLARGTVTELLGAARTEWLCEFLKVNEEQQVFWCDRRQNVLPTALEQRGVALSRVTFGIFEDSQFLKVIRQVLQSQAFEIVVAPNLFNDINAFKAFQLLSEKSNAHLFLMGGTEPHTAWPISTQLNISRTGTDFRVQVIKQKLNLDFDSGLSAI